MFGVAGVPCEEILLFLRCEGKEKKKRWISVVISRRMLWQAVRRWGWNQWCALNHEDWACWTTQPLMTTSDPWGHPLSSIHPIFSFKNNYIIFLLIFLINLLCKISDFHLFVVKIKQLPIRNWRFRSWGWAYGHYSPQGYFLSQSSCWKEFFFSL